MIKIYGVNLSQFPNRQEMIGALSSEQYRVWREHHKSVRNEKVMRSSLAGILLLNMCGMKGTLLYDENGRPYFDRADFDFNITHTEQQIFCAIEDSYGREGLPPLENALPYPSESVPPEMQQRLFGDRLRVGIDAENLDRIASIRICQMASRWFSENEYAFFLSDPTDMTFLRIWTRKEALIKWTGVGLRALRNAETTCAESVYGVRFYEYMLGNTLVTLCCRRGTLPPHDIEMLSNSRLVDFGFSIT